jgi:serine/threonine protein kinase
MWYHQHTDWEQVCKALDASGIPHTLFGLSHSYTNHKLLQRNATHTGHVNSYCYCSEIVGHPQEKVFLKIAEIHLIDNEWRAAEALKGHPLLHVPIDRDGDGNKVLIEGYHSLDNIFNESRYNGARTGAPATHTSSVHFIVSQFIDGQDLFDTYFLPMYRTVPVNDVFWIAHQLFAVLAEIHAMGFVHCDIKLENIMIVTKNGARVLILIDFGFACSEGKPGFSGTPEYDAPEVEMAVHRSRDIYAAGGVLFRLLTGKSPVRDAIGEIQWPFNPHIINSIHRPMVEQMLHSSPGARPTADAARKFYGKWTVGR